MALVDRGCSFDFTEAIRIMCYIDTVEKAVLVNAQPLAKRSRLRRSFDNNVSSLCRKNSQQKEHLVANALPRNKISGRCGSNYQCRNISRHNR